LSMCRINFSTFWCYWWFMLGRVLLYIYSCITLFLSKCIGFWFWSRDCVNHS